VECTENVIRRVRRVGAAIIEQRDEVSERVGVTDVVCEVADVIRDHGVGPSRVDGRGQGRYRVDAVVEKNTEGACMRSKGASYLCDLRIPM
jgi:hypothetical protein